MTKVYCQVCGGARNADTAARIRYCARCKGARQFAVTTPESITPEAKRLRTKRTSVPKVYAFVSDDPQFRSLTRTEVLRFQQWARLNHRAGEAIDEVWHPVIRQECAAIDAEAVTPVTNAKQCPHCGAKLEDA